MVLRVDKLVLLTFLCVFAAFSSSAIYSSLSDYGWHDQQRIFQLTVVVFCSAALFFVPQPSLPLLTRVLLFGIICLGFFSSLLADWPSWALKEWARFSGLLLVVLFVAGLARTIPYLVYALICLLVGVGIIHAFNFVVAYAAVFFSGLAALDVYLLYAGFSNPRFFGQFQILLLPLLVFAVKHCWALGFHKVAPILAFALVIQWCIVFALGGRGVWLGLVAGHCAVLLFSFRIWRLVGLQVVASLLGFGLFLLLFKWAPAQLSAAPAFLVDGLRSTLSNRDQLWYWAWEMAVASPWVGEGPMHYAAAVEELAAHPHQVILQWMAEWGIPAAAMAIVLGLWGVLHGAAFLRNSHYRELDAGLWMSIAGGLCLAQVDGVFVMPYVETWLAVLIGLALARWGCASHAGVFQRVATILLSIPVIGILSFVLIREAPALPEAQAAYILEHHRGGIPRFWEQGWIPMDFK